MTLFSNGAPSAKLPEDDELRPAIVKTLVAIHTQKMLPFLAGLLYSSNQEERMQGVFGISSYVNGCPTQTAVGLPSMDYLRCEGATPFKTAETIDNFAFRRGPSDQESALVAFWRSWWLAHGRS